MNDEMRQAYMDKMEAQLAEWKGKFDVLKAKGLQLKAEAKAEYERRLEELQGREFELLKEMRVLAESGMEKLEILKSKTEVVCNQFKHFLKRWSNKRS